MCIVALFENSALHSFLQHRSVAPTMKCLKVKPSGTVGLTFRHRRFGPHRAMALGDLFVPFFFGGSLGVIFDADSENEVPSAPKAHPDPILTKLVTSCFR